MLIQLRADLSDALGRAPASESELGVLPSPLNLKGIDVGEGSRNASCRSEKRLPSLRKYVTAPSVVGAWPAVPQIRSEV